MLLYQLHQTILCSIHELTHLYHQTKSCGCIICKKKQKICCLVAFVLDARYQDITTRKQNQMGLLELTLVDNTDSNGVYKLMVWGQLAQDRLKHNLRSGSVVAIWNSSLNRDSYGELVIKGDVIAYTPLGESFLEWLHPSSSSLMSNELKDFQQCCDQLLIHTKEDFGIFRKQQFQSLNKRSFGDISKTKRASLFNLSVRIMVRAIFVSGTFVHVNISCW
jgi:hypothetical protein